MFSLNKSIDTILGRKINHPNLLSKKTKNDWDGDGVPNKRDCQPRNFMRQDKFHVVDRVMYKGKERIVKSVMSDFMNPKMDLYGLDGFETALPRELTAIKR